MEVVALSPEPVMSLEEVKQGIIKEMPFMATEEGAVLLEELLGWKGLDRK